MFCLHFWKRADFKVRRSLNACVLILQVVHASWHTWPRKIKKSRVLHQAMPMSALMTIMADLIRIITVLEGAFWCCSIFFCYKCQILFVMKLQLSSLIFFNSFNGKLFFRVNFIKTKEFVAISQNQFVLTKLSLSTNMRLAL